MTVAESSVSESALIQRFQAGDAQAFGELYARYDQSLRAFVCNRCPRGTDAEALIQETWLKIWNARRQYEQDSFSGWVFQIARNLLTDAYRAKGRKPPFEALGEREIVAVIRENDDIRLTALHDCLKTEGGDFVSVLRLRLDGLSTTEIAAQMNIAPSTVFTRASRGEVQLRECMERKTQ